MENMDCIEALRSAKGVLNPAPKANLNVPKGDHHLLVPFGTEKRKTGEKRMSSGKRGGKRNQPI